MRQPWAAVLTVVFGGVALGSAATARTASEQASVLILLPGQPGLPAAAAIAAGIRNVLLTEWSFRVSIEMEHVDVARFASPEVEEQRLRAVYGSKYGNQRFDVIVAALPEPFRFVLRTRDALWPGTPVVACGVDERAVGGLKPPPGFVVVTIRFDMEGTVRAARALLPDTRHVALVGGASPPEQVYHDLIRQAVSAEGALDIMDLTTLPIASVLDRVSRLPEHTIVIQSSYQVDGAGRRFHGIDLVPPVSIAANRPVFTPLGLALGRGVVGGSIIDFEDIGRDAGIFASRLLRGEPPPPTPVASSASAVPRFDGRQLARWHLDERRVPAGSEIVFRQPTLWAEYRWHVVVAVGVLTGQAALIVTLLVQRRRRREAQEVTGAVLATLPGETAVVDSAGTIVQINDAWATAARNRGAPLALEIGENYLETCLSRTDMPPDVARHLHASIGAILRGERAEFATEYPTPRDGEGRWFEVRVRRLPGLRRGAAVMHFDVTARRRAEATAQRHLSQIAHLDRVAGMAQLASSIAHELNQPLGAIMTNAQAAHRLLAVEHPDLTELRACLADIVSDDRRAAEVVRRTRQMLKKTDFVSSPLALNELVTMTIGLVSNDALLHRVSIEFAPAPALPVVHGDSVQIQQVILNLLTNAITAAGGGTVRKVAIWTFSAGAYVEVGVRDFGPGIAEADPEHLFEPFFTTKDEGLGMGLAISRSIVEAHGGRLLAGNDPGGGAKFRLHLRADQPGATGDQHHQGTGAA